MSVHPRGSNAALFEPTKTTQPRLWRAIARIAPGPMTLRNLINTRILATVVVFLVSGMFAAIWQAKASVDEEVSSSMNLALQFVKLSRATVGDGMDGGADPLGVWLQNIVAQEPFRHVQIQVERKAGQPLYVKGQPKPRAGSLAPGWFAWAVAKAYPKVVHTLEGGADGDILVTISADPNDEIDEAWLETRAFFLFFLLLGLGLFVAVNMAFKDVLRSVEKIVHRLNAIENEQYQNRLPLFEILEFDHIAKAIDHLAGTLAKAGQDNNALMLHSLAIQEEERKHLAQELHDEMGQSITAIKVMAVACKKNHPETHGINGSIIAICNHLFAVVRTMMKNLHPLALSELGLKASLEDLLATWLGRDPKIQFQLDCADAADALGPEIAIQIFRIVQEAISNTVRHAKANTMLIALHVENAAGGALAVLDIKDDGIGCALPGLKLGFGLMGIKARINSLGGKAEFRSAPAQGMAIHITIPVTA